MEAALPSVHMWLTFAIIASTVSLYASHRFSVEVISLGTISLLLLLFNIFPLRAEGGTLLISHRDILAGFAHPAVITILCLMVIGQGISQTAAFESPTTILLRYGRHRPKTLVFICLLSVMALSAFLNDTPVVVMFLPIMLVLADKLREAPGRVLMPLSFAAILGGMTTLLGTSTNLLVAGSYKSLTGNMIGFFDFTIPGIVLALTGFTYLWLIGPSLLKSKSGDAKQNRRQHHGRQFIVELHIGTTSPQLGETAVAGILPGLADMTIRAVQRGAHTFLPPFDGVTLKAEDHVIGAITRDKLHDLLGEDHRLLRGGRLEHRAQQDRPEASDSNLFELLVSPASTLEGRTLQEVGTNLKGGGMIVGLQRKTRMARISLYDIRLEAGDILLVRGSTKQIRKLRTNRDVILMEWSGHAIREKRKKRVSQAIFLGTVLLAASGTLPIVIAALSGAFLMVSSGCLNVYQAARAVNRRVYLLAVAALAMGTAMDASGGAAFLSQALLELLEGASATILLSALFFIVALISNILSNNTTALLFTPVAIDMANAVSLPALPFVITIIFAANCSFATPVSYQTNLLIMGPGRYKFMDYVRVGTPLAVLLWVVFTLFVPWYYGL